MNHSFQDVCHAALGLTPDERADLAELLCVSLDKGDEDFNDPLFADEIQRRIEDITSGRVTPISWESVRQRLMDIDGGPDAG